MLGVKLEPDRTYAIWLNQGQNMDFKDTNMTPSAPYLLVFKTASK